MSGAVDLHPAAGAAYVDSWFLARATIEPSTAADALECTWRVDGVVMAATEGVPSRGDAGWECAADGLTLGLDEGAAVWAELEFLRREVSIGRLESEVRFVDRPPLIFVTEMDNGTLALVDSANDEVLQRTELFDDDTLVDSVSGASATWGFPMQVGYTPAGDRVLASSSRSGYLWEVDPETGLVVGRHQISEAIYGYAWSADASTLYVTDDANEGVAIVDADRWVVEDFIPTGQMPITAELDADGVLYVPNQLANTVSVIDTATLEVREVATSSNPYHAVPEPGLKRLWVAEEVPGVVEVWSLPYLEPVAALKVGSHSVAVTFSPWDDTFFVSDFLDSCIYYGSTTTLEVIGAIPTGSGSLGLTWRDDGRILYVANLQEGTVSVVDAIHRRKMSDIWNLLGPRHVAQVRR